MSYQLAETGVIDTSTGQRITRDMREWADYRVWLKAGGVPEPMPVVVTPRWPDLDTGRADVWAQCRLRRDALEAGGFPYMGHPLDSDPRAVQRINTAVQAAQSAVAMGQPFLIVWTCMDGHGIELDAAGMIGVPVELAMYANALHQIAKSFKVRIAAAESFAELEQIEAEIAGEWMP